MATINPLKGHWNGSGPKVLALMSGSARREVDIRHDPHDFLVCLLGSCGFSNRCIEKYTHMSSCQIHYRLKKGNVSRTAYRNGDSPYALRILRAAPHMVLPLLQRNMKKFISAKTKPKSKQS